MRRTGIDLSPARCIVVEAEAAISWRKHSEATSLRVRHFASLAHPDSAQALTAELKALASRQSFPKRAWVNVWDVQSSHQYLLCPAASRSELEAVARERGAAVLGLDPRDVTVGVSIGATHGEAGQQKTELSFFAVGSQDIRSRLRPIVDAGFVVEGVTTPCGALWSQARLKGRGLKGEVHAYVAVGVTMSALAVVSNGLLVYARDLNWGYGESPIGTPMPLSREDLADRLSAELQRSFLYVKQYWEEGVSQVSLCGDMPEVRSLTAPLIERLNIEVETLDTLEGIDSTALPEPTDQFVDQVATFRLAAAIAVKPPPVNLLPFRVTAERVNRTGRRVLVAGSAAAVAVGAFLYGQAGVERTQAEQIVANLRREQSVIQPRARLITMEQQRSEIEAGQREALEALDSQGPRMARMLEALSQASPREVTLKAVRAVPDGATWLVTIDALVEDSDPERVRQVVDGFLEGIERSPLFGGPVRPPSRRILAGGIELRAQYAVRK